MKRFTSYIYIYAIGITLISAGVFYHVNKKYEEFVNIIQHDFVSRDSLFDQLNEKINKRVDGFSIVDSALSPDTTVKSTTVSIDKKNVPTIFAKSDNKDVCHFFTASIKEIEDYNEQFKRDVTGNFGNKLGLGFFSFIGLNNLKRIDSIRRNTVFISYNNIYNYALNFDCPIVGSDLHTNSKIAVWGTIDSNTEVFNKNKNHLIIPVKVNKCMLLSSTAIPVSLNYYPSASDDQNCIQYTIPPFYNSNLSIQPKDYLAKFCRNNVAVSNDTVLWITNVSTFDNDCRGNSDGNVKLNFSLKTLKNYKCISRNLDNQFSLVRGVIEDCNYTALSFTLKLLDIKAIKKKSTIDLISQDNLYENIVFAYDKLDDIAEKLCRESRMPAYYIDTLYSNGTYLHRDSFAWIGTIEFDKFNPQFVVINSHGKKVNLFCKDYMIIRNLTRLDIGTKVIVYGDLVGFTEEGKLFGEIKNVKKVINQLSP